MPDALLPSRFFRWKERVVPALVRISIIGLLRIVKALFGKSMILQRKSVIKALKYCIITLILLNIILFALGMYSLITGLMGAISEGTFGLELNQAEPPSDWSLVLHADPRNNGFLGERLFIQLGIINSTGQYIALNSTSVYIPPGGQSPFSLVLTIPYEEVQKYNITETGGAPVVFELVFGLRTLGELVGFTQTMRISGEPQI